MLNDIFLYGWQRKFFECWKSDKNGPAVKEVSILSVKRKMLEQTMVN